MDDFPKDRSTEALITFNKYIKLYFRIYVIFIRSDKEQYIALYQLP